MWVLENDADEIHNFHIHQSKFRLASPDDLKDSGVTGDAVQNPRGILDPSPGLCAALMAESESKGAVGRDSIPVPPRLDAATPGRTIVVPRGWAPPRRAGRMGETC